MTLYPDIRLCYDEECDLEHNPVDDDEARHHYGCECSLCLDFYRSLK